MIQILKIFKIIFLSILLGFLGYCAGESNDPNNEQNDTIGESTDLNNEQDDTTGESTDLNNEQDDTTSESNDPNNEQDDTTSESNDPNNEQDDTTSESNDPNNEQDDTTSESNDPNNEQDDTTSESNDPNNEQDDTTSESNDPNNEQDDTTSESNNPTTGGTDQTGETEPINTAICSADALEKVNLAANHKNAAIVCSDGIVLMDHEAEHQTLKYPTNANIECDNPSEEGTESNSSCPPDALKTHGSSFAALWGKKHILHFSTQEETPELSFITLDREITDFGFTSGGKYLIVLDTSGYLTWFDTQNSYSKKYELPLRNQIEVVSPSPPAQRIVQSITFENTSTAKWPSLSISEHYIFVLRADTNGDKIYRLPLFDSNDQEIDPSTTFNYPTVGVQRPGNFSPPYALIELPQSNVLKTENALVPSSLSYLGFVATRTGNILNKEVGRLYIAHKNSADIRICDASEVNPRKTGHGWLNFGSTNVNTTSVLINTMWIDTRTYTPRKISADSNSPCTTLERYADLSSNPVIRHSALKRFVYILSANQKVNIINNDYYYEWHNNHPHDRLYNYAKIPFTITASKFASFYNTESLTYYQRSQIDANFLATIALLDKKTLRYFQEKTTCFNTNGEDVAQCRGEAVLSQSDIKEKETTFPESSLSEITLIGDTVFYIFKKDNSLHVQTEKISF